MMRKDKAGVRILGVIAWALILGAGSTPLLGAEKTVEKSEEKSVSQVAAPEHPSGLNVEKLLYTLNETLQENR
ncbi:MAG: hypothetical protein PHV97_01865, partial [Candidatus Omnitrophica bacterium]|nr:hypothetical protein [Candidatus Omnitrophota bacterium]